MNALFVDSAGWMACADAADPDHAAASRARDAALEAGRTLVTTDLVLDETLTLMRLRLGIAAARRWWRQIEETRRLRWEWIEAQRFDQARALFFQYGDKRFSLTDCTSFVVMRELRLLHALTTDRHFRQMGFQVLPGHPSRAGRRRRT